jgi:hypothetical protein
MIHVLVPHSRWWFKDLLLEHLSKLPVEVHLLTYPTATNEPGYEKLNLFIWYENIIDDDFYCILNDDDFYEEGVFDNLPDADVIFISMDCGDNRVSGNACLKLPACPEYIHVGSVGSEQFIVKGKVLKQMRYRTDICTADGEMAMWLKDNFNCVYEPDRVVKFNYLEPGRWNEVKFDLRNDHE